MAQEKWQQDLLLRYGNAIFLLDATYKTTKYSLPLFFVCVKTNVDYMVVGYFVIQNEDASSIDETLEYSVPGIPHGNTEMQCVTFLRLKLMH